MKNLIMVSLLKLRFLKVLIFEKHVGVEDARKGYKLNPYSANPEQIKTGRKCETNFRNLWIIYKRKKNFSQKKIKT